MIPGPEVEIVVMFTPAPEFVTVNDRTGADPAKKVAALIDCVAVNPPKSPEMYPPTETAATSVTATSTMVATTGDTPRLDVWAFFLIILLTLTCCGVDI